MTARAEREERSSRTVCWSDPGLKKLIRLRFVSTPKFPFMDVEEVVGRMRDGRLVMVQLPFAQLPRRHYLGALMDYARRDGVYLEGLGIFSGTVISIRIAGRTLELKDHLERRDRGNTH